MIKVSPFFKCCIRIYVENLGIDASKSLACIAYTAATQLAHINNDLWLGLQMLY